MPRLRSLSVFYPSRNEAATLRALVGRTLEAMEPHADALEVIVVDDGSTDSTPDVVAGLAAGDSRVRTVRHQRSGGYGAALRSGFAAARHEWVFFTDGDAQFDVGEFPLLLAELDRGADLVIGWRSDRQDPWLRRLNGHAWNWLVRRLFSIHIRDVNCAFKLMPARALQSMTLTTRGAVISTELLVLAHRRGLRIAEVAVSHRPRTAGRSSGDDATVIVRAFWELFTLRWRFRRG
jgi:glycosyltransferase involved in cell wall biosynthesis